MTIGNVPLDVDCSTLIWWREQAMIQEFSTDFYRRGSTPIARKYAIEAAYC